MPATYKDTIDNKALTTKYQAKGLTLFTVVEVKSVNHRPHPFLIGPRHVTHAADKCGGRLVPETIHAIPCAHCHNPAENHSFDIVLILTLKRTMTTEEAKKELLSLDKDMEADHIDGFVFMQTPEHYEITKG